MFRFLQAVVQITTAYAWPFDLLLQILSLSTTKTPSPAITRSILLEVRQRLDLGRRFFRIFRFFEFFQAAHRLYLSISTSKPINGKQKSTLVKAATWMDIMNRTFNGMYLLLEASTIIDLLQVEGLQLLGKERVRMVNVEAQRFWLFALVCGVSSGLFKMMSLVAYSVTPATESELANDKPEGRELAAKEREGVEEPEQGTKSHTMEEKQRLPKIFEPKAIVQVLWTNECRSKLQRLFRTVVANSLDIAVPGVIVGWIDISPGIVGIIMTVTTVLTGIDVWERCGREISSGN